MRREDVILDEYYLELQDEGNLGLESSIKYLRNEEIKKQPYPGIRPFKTIEAPIFYGREGLSNKLIKKLEEYCFLAIIGGSGSGKSSLVRAGLIPYLYAGYHEKAGVSWQIALCRPGNNPIRNLAFALASIKSKSRNAETILTEVEPLYDILNHEANGIEIVANRIYRAHNKKPNILIVIDQFEELFRFKNEHGNEDSKHFVKLLTAIPRLIEKGIYLIITMRSEFLGDCAQFTDLPEIINRGQFLIPRLKRNNIRDAITKPALMAGKKINPLLVQKLLNDVGDDMDQLSVLQHSLMRTYAQLNGETEITLEHFKSAGGMKLALSKHADEIIEMLSPGDQVIVKVIFQRLTDISSDDRGVRRTCKLMEIKQVCKSLNGLYVSMKETVSPKTEIYQTKSRKGFKIDVTDKNIFAVINKFRAEENAFLMPPTVVSLESDPILDISHESLMRNWGTLENWIEEERSESELYTRLNQSRMDQLQEKKKGKKHHYLRGTVLQGLKEINWKNAAWAARYNATKSNEYKALLKKFEESDKFQKKESLNSYPLITDEVVFKLNREYFEKCVKADKQRKRKPYLIAYLFVIGGALFTIFAQQAKSRAEKAEIEAYLNQSIANSARSEAEKLRVEAEIANKRAQEVLYQIELSEKSALRSKKESEKANKDLRTELRRNASFRESLSAAIKNNASLSDSLYDAIENVDFTRNRLDSISVINNNNIKSYNEVLGVKDWEKGYEEKGLGYYFAKAKKAYELDSTNVFAKRYIKEIFFNHYLENDSIKLFFVPGYSDFAIKAVRIERNGLSFDRWNFKKIYLDSSLTKSSNAIDIGTIRYYRSNYNRFLRVSLDGKRIKVNNTLFDCVSNKKEDITGKRNFTISNSYSLIVYQVEDGLFGRPQKKFNIEALFVDSSDKKDSYKPIKFPSTWWRNWVADVAFNPDETKIYIYHSWKLKKDKIAERDLITRRDTVYESSYLERDIYRFNSINYYSSNLVIIQDAIPIPRLIELNEHFKLITE